MPLEDQDPTNAPFYSTVILSLVAPTTVSNVPPPFACAWPTKAGAIIFEESIYPFGPPIGLRHHGPTVTDWLSNREANWGTIRDSDNKENAS